MGGGGHLSGERSRQPSPEGGSPRRDAFPGSLSSARSPPAPRADGPASLSVHRLQIKRSALGKLTDSTHGHAPSLPRCSPSHRIGHRHSLTFPSGRRRPRAGAGASRQTLPGLWPGPSVTLGLRMQMHRQQRPLPLTELAAQGPAHTGPSLGTERCSEGGGRMTEGVCQRQSGRPSCKRGYQSYTGKEK